MACTIMLDVTSARWRYPVLVTKQDYNGRHIIMEWVEFLNFAHVEIVTSICGVKVFREFLDHDLEIPTVHCRCSPGAK